MALPALRDIDAFPVEHEGQTYACLRDSEGYAEAQVLLSPLAFTIAALLDGENDVLDIQYRLASEHNGQIATSDEVLSVVGFLDEKGFLLSPRFLEIRDRAHRTFSEASVREAVCVGQSYPDAQEELKAQLDGMLGPDEDDAVCPRPLPRLLIAPHIDFARGAAGYGAAYRMLRGCPAPKRVFVFGVAHAGGDAPFILTRKDFGTPLGVLRNDTETVDRLARLCPVQEESLRRADEYVHKGEHSLEFQMVWLAHLFGDAPCVVPILCGDTLSQESSIRFVRACREIVGEEPVSTLVIAGADLAHVGRCFDDDFDITPELISQIEERDRRDLDCALRLDATGFVKAVLRDGNARRVCGVSCIHAAVASVTGIAGQGRLLHYGHAPDPADGLVSFASAVFE